jgi:hypothetical protein
LVDDSHPIRRDAVWDREHQAPAIRTLLLLRWAPTVLAVSVVGPPVILAGFAVAIAWIMRGGRP